MWYSKFTSPYAELRKQKENPVTPEIRTSFATMDNKNNQQHLTS